MRISVRRQGSEIQCLPILSRTPNEWFMWNPNNQIAPNRPSIDPNWALEGRYAEHPLSQQGKRVDISLYIIHGGPSSHENAYDIFDPKDFLKFHYFGVYQIPKWKPIFQPNPSLFRVPWFTGDAQSGRSEAVVAWRPSWSLRPWILRSLFSQELRPIRGKCPQVEQHDLNLFVGGGWYTIYRWN